MRAQAPRLRALVSPLGIVMFAPGRLSFASLDTFVYFEEADTEVTSLHAFFTSFDGATSRSMTAPWYTYRLEPAAGGVRLILTNNPPPPGTLRAASDGPVLDYTFTGSRWQNFEHAWAEFD